MKDWNFEAPAAAAAFEAGADMMNEGWRILSRDEV